MNIAVVGTSGKSGRVFAMAAVAAGHQVRGGIYHKNSGLEAQGLTLVKCDATNQQDYRAGRRSLFDWPCPWLTCQCSN
jgi:putative NADH-flavin reductase